MGIPTTGVSQLFFGVVLAHLIASTLAMILLGVSCFYEAKAEGFGLWLKCLCLISVFLEPGSLTTTCACSESNIS